MPQRPVRRESQRRPRGARSTPRRSKSTWEAAVARFIDEGKRKNLSPSTLGNYAWYLSGFRTRDFLADNGVTSPAEFSADKLRAFEGELLRVGVSAGTVATFHRILKNFVGFCQREGLGGDAKVLQVEGPKLAQEEPETFTPDEERRLLAAVKDKPRDEAIILLMLGTGLRLQEVCNVLVDDLVDSPQGAYVRVRQGKGRKDRIVPLDTGTSRLSVKLTRYVDKVRPQDTRQHALFLANRRDGDDYAPLSASAIQNIFKRLGKETGIHMNPHKFRHTFATRALSAGVDVMALQKALGHTTLAMVSRYVHYQKDDLLEAWRQRRD
jgi:integrase/recombinase XerD